MRLENASVAKKKPTVNVALRRTQTARPRRDALALLTADHKEVKKLFRAYKKCVKADGPDKEKHELAEQICTLLTVHATVEEEIFYPAAREDFEDQSLLNEAEVEHASAKELIAQIQASDTSDPLYDAKVTVLGEYIDHHVHEEESQIFPKAKKAKLDLTGLGEQLLARKEALLEEIGRKK